MSHSDAMETPITGYQRMGYDLACYLEEKGLYGSKLHVHGAGDIVTLFIPNVNEKLLREVVIRGVAATAVQYDYYLEVCEKPKRNGVCIYLIPRKGWRTHVVE